MEIPSGFFQKSWSRRMARPSDVRPRVHGDRIEVSYELKPPYSILAERIWIQLAVSVFAIFFAKWPILDFYDECDDQVKNDDHSQDRENNPLPAALAVKPAASIFSLVGFFTGIFIAPCRCDFNPIFRNP